MESKLRRRRPIINNKPEHITIIANIKCFNCNYSKNLLSKIEMMGIYDELIHTTFKRRY